MMGESINAYMLRPFERATIQNVKKCLNERQYSRHFSAGEHLTVLRTLLNRMAAIEAAEAQAGMINWELRAVMQDVRNTCMQIETKRVEQKEVKAKPAGMQR